MSGRVKRFGRLSYSNSQKNYIFAELTNIITKEETKKQKQIKHRVKNILDQAVGAELALHRTHQSDKATGVCALLEGVDSMVVV